MKFSDEGIRELSKAVFAIENPFVVEAYSEFDSQPLSFVTAEDLEKYIAEHLSEPKDSAHLFIVYPEMLGKAKLKRIELDQQRVAPYKYRYTWEGWGLISVCISSPTHGITSYIDANSETRANEWSSTYFEYEPASSWDWRAVNKHKNRLKRVLKRYAQQGH